MKTQDYILKKFVKATSAEDAIRQDSTTPVAEAFLTSERPQEGTVSAVGFTCYPDNRIPYEAQRIKR